MLDYNKAEEYFSPVLGDSFLLDLRKSFDVIVQHCCESGSQALLELSQDPYLS